MFLMVAGGGSQLLSRERPPVFSFESHIGVMAYTVQLFEFKYGCLIPHTIHIIPDLEIPLNI